MVKANNDKANNGKTDADLNSPKNGLNQSLWVNSWFNFPVTVL